MENQQGPKRVIFFPQFEQKGNFYRNKKMLDNAKKRYIFQKRSGIVNLAKTWFYSKDAGYNTHKTKLGIQR